MRSDSLSQFTDFVGRNDFFYIAGHEGPDLDCLCSQIVLGSILRRLGKRAVLVSAGPFLRSDIVEFSDLFRSSFSDFESIPGYAVVLVDCSSMARTGLGFTDCDGFIIDHHEIIDNVQYPGYIVPHSPSTTLLVLHLAKSLNFKLSRDDAELLILGFCSDTGFFRHLVPDSVPFMLDVQELLSYGVSLAKICSRLEGDFSLDSRRYMGKLLAGCQSYAEDKLLMIVEEKCNVELDRDSSTLYQVLLSVRGVEIVALMRPKDNGYSVGLRSKSSVNVGLCASHFGGGGHARAAGFFTTCQVSEVKDYLLKFLDT